MHTPKKDFYNITSFCLLIIGIPIIYILNEYFLATPNKTFINELTVFSSVYSFIGLLITYLQLYKISSIRNIYEQTFTKTINEIKKNDLIEVVSSATQQVDLIKLLSEKGDINKTANNFNQLMILLCKIQSIESIKKTSAEEDLNKYIEFCEQMEIELLMNDLDENMEMREKYTTLTQIQKFLKSLQLAIKTPEKE